MHPSSIVTHSTHRPQSRFLLALLLNLLAISVPAAAVPNILYVDAHATDAPHDGSDWCHAFTELHQALAVATPGTEIRIAAGVYRPDPTGLGDPRQATFTLLPSVTITGGFAGCGAPNPDFNDAAIHTTTLSGDIGTPNLDSDNCYHVFVGSGVSSSTVIQSVTITGGNANGSGANRQGGGMLLFTAAPTIRSCIFRDNHAVFGAGVFNGEGFPRFVGTTFTQNVASGSGGGVYNYNATWDPPPTFANCTFSNNSAQGYAGAMRNYGSFVDIMDCSFTANLALSAGGALANGGWTQVNLARCLFSQNRADTLFSRFDALGGAIFCEDVTQLTLRSCVFHLNVANATLPGISYGGAIAQADDTLITLENCTFVGQHANVGRALHHSGSGTTTLISSILANGGNEIVTTGSASVTLSYSAITHSWPGTGNTGADPMLDNLRLRPGSPCINTGDPAAVPAFNEPDFDGHARILCNRIDMGAFEFGLGDFDCNQSVNPADFAHWSDCMTGPDVGPHPDPCAPFDYDFDQDIDLRDFAAFHLDVVSPA
ncbi:MAG: hypothetical protein IPM18_11460 [Phycisphaerales bacterium]|nr:hypothetical protein [Phycisphaerales bacterium]